jgi:hypothetical protein
MGVFRGGVADKICDQLQHVGVVADVMERVVAIGAIRVNQVKNLDGVPLPEQQGDGVAGEFPFSLGLSRTECGNFEKIRMRPVRGG